MGERKAHKTDLTEFEWAVIEPYYLDFWKRGGPDRRINEVLRMMVPEKAGHHPDPSRV